MTEEEKILSLFEEYFKTASKEEIEEDAKYINGLGSNGISFEGYLEVLNNVTSYSLIETGLCDDIAYADLFNSTILPVQMDQSNRISVIKDLVNISTKPALYDQPAGESNYAMAA